MACAVNNKSVLSRQFAVLLMAAWLLAGCGETTTPVASNDYFHQADLLTVERQDNYQITRHYLGKITAKQHTTASFEFGGIVKEIYVDNGDQVHQGQALALLDTELLTIQHQQVTAELTQLSAQIALNSNNLKRVRQLEKDGFSSVQRIDELLTEQKVLNANSEAATAKLSSINYKIKQATLVAPFAGVITKRFIDSGEKILLGQPAIELFDPSQLEAKVGVPASIAQKLNLDQQMTVQIDKQQVSAKLIAIGQQVDSANRTVELRLALANPQYFNGQIMQLAIDEVIPQQGFWLPISAITDGIRGQWNIYQATPAEHGLYQLSSVTVNVLHTSATHAFIALPSTNVEHVVAAGLHRYVPKQLVRSELNAAKNNRG